MTRTELRAVTEEYKKEIKTVWESQQDKSNWVVGFCLDLAEEMCYNHHERGQRLWAFFQALKEIEGE